MTHSPAYKIASASAARPVRKFGTLNIIGTLTLIRRETKRFLNVWSQTVMAPLINATLLVMIFTIAIGERRGDVMGVPYITFLIPGIMTMSIIQNAFANTSSSLISAKLQGNIVDTLMPPLSTLELLIGYLSGALIRGVLVGLVIFTGTWLFYGTTLIHPVWAVYFAVIGSIFMGSLGMIAGIYAQKFDQLSTITNFIITPLSFLSGTFYSITALPSPLQWLSYLNPFFYIIDGMRFSLLGVSDASPWIGSLILLIYTSGLVALVKSWLDKGYRIKN